jgi:hypothetical protein
MTHAHSDASISTAATLISSPRPPPLRVTPRVPWVSRPDAEKSVQACLESNLSGLALENARANDYRFPLVTGQSGAGKTSLGENIEHYIELPESTWGKTKLVHLLITPRTSPFLPENDQQWDLHTTKPKRVPADIARGGLLLSSSIAAAYFLSTSEEKLVRELSVQAPAAQDLAKTVKAIRLDLNLDSDTTLILVPQFDEFQWVPYACLCAIRSLADDLRAKKLQTQKAVVMPFLSGTLLGSMVGFDPTDYKPTQIFLGGLTPVQSGCFLDSVAQMWVAKAQPKVRPPNHTHAHNHAHASFICFSFLLLYTYTHAHIGKWGR